MCILLLKYLSSKNSTVKNENVNKPAKNIKEIERDDTRGFWGKNIFLLPTRQYTFTPLINFFIKTGW
jgi:hypothetical protein